MMMRKAARGSPQKSLLRGKMARMRMMRRESSTWTSSPTSSA
jgi:hypothetical protein